MSALRTMIDKNQRECLLSLIRLGIGNNHAVSFPSNHINWRAIESIAEKQGLSAIVLDGIEQLPETVRPPKEDLLQWIGCTLQIYEYRYELYRQAISEIASFYNSHGFKMMVLKGFSCSLTWPKPAHRPCGDIDIWLFGKQKEADLALLRELNIKIDSSHHHHTVFFWKSFMVENHYDFINVYHHKSNAELEGILKKLGMVDNNKVQLLGETIYLPSPMLHTIFLLRHASGHFATSEISLRMLLDWAFHIKYYSREIDWKSIISTIEEFGMKPIFAIFNAICIEDLGFEATLFPNMEYDKVLKERVLMDIIIPEFSGIEPQCVVSRVLFKIRRWNANGWKHALCYKENRLSSFLSATWNHILKPSSI